MSHKYDAIAESVLSAIAVFAFGVAVGLTAMGLHNGAPQCQMLAGQPISDHCRMLAWGEQQAVRAIQVSLLAFGAGMVVARADTVREWWADWRGGSS